MGQLRMVPVAVARDGFEARVIAARLGSEGIVWELRGHVGGPYPIGQVAVLVDAADLEVAREVLSPGADVGDAGDEPSSAGGAGLWFAVLLAVVVLGSALLRVLAAT